ncbi:MAG TPA: hypothetical protein PKL78_12840 [Anaerolineales bacterium]|nr:hypothetical protein [Anaerolineales bacterium]HNO30774.1 hypothetical protein [Anaerolineales bacterium]
MKTIFRKMITLLVIFTTLSSQLDTVKALGQNELAVANTLMPVQQAVIYQAQTVPYDNFNAAIFAQGQIKSEASKLPAGSEISLYVDTDKINGPAGLVLPGVRCTTAQAGADYYKNTITMDKRFCSDINDAILDGRSVYGMVPTETVFLHKSNGERCYAPGNGGGVYMINPASPFIRNYLAKRGMEKMTELGVSTFYLDDLRVGSGSTQSKCGGNPVEYSNFDNYLLQMMALAKFVTTNTPGYHVQGNLAGASAEEWDQYSFLNGALCESCFSDWGRAWPSAAQMLEDLSVLDKWVNQYGRTVYIVTQAPDIAEASNRFAFAASLLIARNDGKGVYFHFGDDYGQTYLIPEYQYTLGLPLGIRFCTGNVCTRNFEYGTVTVDFASRQATISLNGAPVTPAPSGVTKVNIRVSAGRNDAEESSAGTMSLRSSDLELINDGGIQTVGVRFVNVTVPQGALITKAYIRFKVDSPSSDVVTLNIYGERKANAPVFTSQVNNISSRAKTAKFVKWSPPAWTAGGITGRAQTTSNLAGIVQEIVNLQNWKPGNSMVFIFTGNAGQRVAEAFEGDIAGAPLLHIEYTLETASFSQLSDGSFAATTIPTVISTEVVIPSPVSTDTPTEDVEPTETPSPTPASEDPVTPTEETSPTDAPSPTPTP